MELQAASRFAKFSWAVLLYNEFVILFGAYVRASGSGAGCGAHWPLCNGVIIPRPERIETIIEFTHRVTSGIALPLVILLLVWAWRAFPKGSGVRTSSLLAFVFTITEALVGAGLVLFQLVADNDSVARAIWMAVHLVNTFILLAMLTVTAWWSTNGAPGRLRFVSVSGLLLILGSLGMLVLGASGAITALGDTLYPSESLSAGIQEEFSPTAHYLIRLRVYHPGIAVAVGIFLFLTTVWIRRQNPSDQVDRITNILFGLYGLQVILGVVNVALLAPIWMQIIHLFVANLVWVAFILLSVSVLGGFASRVSEHPVHQEVRQVPG